jgi:hypothetical protein
MQSVPASRGTGACGAPELRARRVAGPPETGQKARDRGGKIMVGVAGFEPATPASRKQCSFSKSLILHICPCASTSFCSRWIELIHCDFIACSGCDLVALCRLIEEKTSDWTVPSMRPDWYTRCCCASRRCCCRQGAGAERSLGTRFLCTPNRAAMDTPCA